MGAGVAPLVAGSGPRGRRLPLGAPAPWPTFFLGDGAAMEDLLPLLGGCQGEGISWLCVPCSKNRVSPQYIEVEIQSRPWDGCPFDPRILGHL